MMKSWLPVAAPGGRLRFWLLALVAFVHYDIRNGRVQAYEAINRFLARNIWTSKPGSDICYRMIQMIFFLGGSFGDGWSSASMAEHLLSQHLGQSFKCMIAGLKVFRFSID
jgi:hypothetical protein